MAPKTTTTRKATSTKKAKTTTTRAKKASTTSTTKKSVTKKSTARKYSPSSQTEVAKEMRKYKKGTAKSGKAETPVKSRAQAIAIGLSKAREKGAKVPKKKSSKK